MCNHALPSYSSVVPKLNLNKTVRPIPSKPPTRKKKKKRTATFLHFRTNVSFLKHFRGYIALSVAKRRVWRHKQFLWH